MFWLDRVGAILPASELLPIPHEQSRGATPIQAMKIKLCMFQRWGTFLWKSLTMATAPRCHSDMTHKNKIELTQVFTWPPRNTQILLKYLSLAGCDWDFLNKAFWDVLRHAALCVFLSFLSTGPVALSTACNLIAYGIPIAGTLSITKYEIFFEWDDENDHNKKIDNKVSSVIR